MSQMDAYGVQAEIQRMHIQIRGLQASADQERQVHSEIL